MNLERIKIWDLPVRLFHWLLVLLLVAAVVTAKIGGNAMDWHGRIGLCILGLIVFRIVWGFVGSFHARFASFWPTPSSLRAYLRGEWSKQGHNPLGALSVLALLALIGFQATTGLFSTDDIAFSGPLNRLVSEATSSTLTRIHKVSANAILTLVALHLAAIAFYVLIKKETLIKPMITGWKSVSAGSPRPPEMTTGHRLAALLVSVLIALLVVYGASGS
jgi:cytochrome b